MQGQGATPTGFAGTAQTSIPGFGALTLSTSATLAYSGTAGTVVFTSFTPNGSTLNVTGSNFDTTGQGGTDGSNDRLIFTTSQTANLGNIDFGGVADATQITLSDGSFEIEAISSVPEPATCWADS